MPLLTLTPKRDRKLAGVAPNGDPCNHSQKVFIERDDLHRMYVAEGHHIRWIAKHLGVSVSAVNVHLRLHEIWLSPEQLRARKAHTGANHPLYRGGKITQNGYIYLARPDDPSANRDGYVMEHRMAVSAFIGRRLYQGEQVHHIDFDKAHNRIENLMLFPSAAAHTEFHKWMERVGAYTLGMITRAPEPIQYRVPVLVAGAWTNEISIELLGAIKKVA